MPTGCSVPICQGNYRNGPKVQVFGFPKDPDLRRKWINAIKMDDEPTDYSKVCEHHFLPHQIRHETTATDPATGKQLTVRLDLPRLIPNAVPSQFPPWPASMSAAQITAPRKSMQERLAEKENDQLRRAVEESCAAFEEEKKMDSCTSYDEFRSKLNVSEEWTVIYKRDQTQIIYVPESARTTTPHIECAVTVDRSLTVHVSLLEVKLLRVKDIEVPLKLDSMNKFDTILCELLKLVKPKIEGENGVDDTDLFVTLGVILSLLQPFLIDSTWRFYDVLWFVHEQTSNPRVSKGIKSTRVQGPNQ